MEEGRGGGVGSSGDSDSASSSITVQVKFGGRTISLSVSPDSSVRELKSLLQPLTNVLPRGQKLICKGKVLADPATLKSSQISDGSKVMLVASHGVHQGDGPITNHTSANLRKNVNVSRTHGQQASVAIEKSRLERWRLTGIVALSDFQLKKTLPVVVREEDDLTEMGDKCSSGCRHEEFQSSDVIPEEVWACGLQARLLDLSNNFIAEIPAKIGTLASISKLFLNANNLSDNSINWEGISCLKSLAILNLSQNHLTALPSALCTLTSLTQVDLANNRLTGLPDDIGNLNQLQVLKTGNNRIRSIPSTIGNCSSLIEVDLSSNLLDCLPEAFGLLTNLKCLQLRNNGLQSLPATLLKMCTQLSTLDLHGTQITDDVLRQLEGWEAFDERRRLKHQKQLDFRLGVPQGFDEGADKNNGP